MAGAEDFPLATIDEAGGVSDPALVWVAGLPAATAAALGTPDLTERVRHLIRAETAYRACAADVAARMGEELIPALPPDLRRHALEVRRRLHRGEFAQPGELEFRPLARVAEWGAALAAETAALHEAVADTERMRYGLVWDLIRHDPATRRLVLATAPDVVEDVRARLAAGEPWTSKCMRKRADFLLRLLWGAAFKTTSRGWLAHVALTGTAPGPPPAGDTGMHRLSSPSGPHASRGGQHAGSGKHATRSGQHDGRGGELSAPSGQLSALSGKHAAPSNKHGGRGGELSAPSGQHDGRGGGRGGAGDRCAHGGIPIPARLPELVAHAGRLAVVLAGRRSHPALDLVGPDPRPVSAIVARALDLPRPAWPGSAWPAPRPRTVYQRLCEWMARHADECEIDLGPAVLDYLGVPPGKPSPWPVDCVLRPLPDGRAVLEAITPAGVTDTRFAATPHVRSHRAFLTETAARCGAELVEILVPPQGSEGTGTTRPRYTFSWTGAGDLVTFVDDPAGMRRYLPLEEITVRRDARGVIAEDRAGRVLWPLYHAAGRPAPPWDLVVSLLTAASPAQRLVTPRAFGDPRAAFPGRARTPRLLLDRDLVIAPATVFAGRDLLPQPGGDQFGRVRALANLRLVTGAPRWVFARHGHQSRPVDLDSTATLRVFDRMLADPAVDGLVLEEMLPAPDDLVVSDVDGGRCAARALVRLPLNTSPSQLAEEVAAAWQRITSRRRARETTAV